MRCRYDGTASPSGPALEAARAGRAIPVCPEIMGGLPTPRPRAEISGGDGAAVLAGKAHVLTEDGRDVTAAFLRGAEEALRLSQLCGIQEAWLKARSPSCGVSCVYDGTFAGRVRSGRGVTAALLSTAGIRLREIP